jgi:hypothetical protein
VKPGAAVFVSLPIDDDSDVADDDEETSEEGGGSDDDDVEDKVDWMGRDDVTLGEEGFVKSITSFDDDDNGPEIDNVDVGDEAGIGGINAGTGGPLGTEIVAIGNNNERTFRRMAIVVASRANAAKSAPT